jgi:hypothetical protein
MFYAVFSSHLRLAHVVCAHYSIHYCIANQTPADLPEKKTQFAGRKKMMLQASHHIRTDHTTIANVSLLLYHCFN